MSASLQEVVAALDAELRVREIPDYPGALNGLQVANRGAVSRVAVAVDGSLATINAAVAERADLLVLHHGLFWGGAQPLTGIAYDKYSAMLTNGLAVYASHLPLDLHPVHGNNACLARALDLAPTGGFASFKGVHIGLRGEAKESTAALVERVRHVVAPYGGVVRTSVPTEGRETTRWAICSGGGASTETLREAREKKVLAFGTNSDQNGVAPDVVIASVLIDQPKAFLRIAREVQSKQFKGRVIGMGVKEDVVRLVYNPTMIERIPASVRAKVDSVGASLKAGTFHALDDILVGADSAKKSVP